MEALLLPWDYIAPTVVAPSGGHLQNRLGDNNEMELLFCNISVD